MVIQLHILLSRSTYRRLTLDLRLARLLLVLTNERFLRGLIIGLAVLALKLLS
jgi:hypothetical protein